VLNQCQVILDQGEFLVDLLKNHKSGEAILPEQLEPLIERFDSTKVKRFTDARLVPGRRFNPQALSWRPLSD